MAEGKKSKTNVTGRAESPRDPRPKSELVVESYIKENGHVGQRSYFRAINRDPLHSA